jgi:hypothetical protein
VRFAPAFVVYPTEVGKLGVPLTVCLGDKRGSETGRVSCDNFYRSAASGAGLIAGDVSRCHVLTVRVPSTHSSGEMANGPPPVPRGGPVRRSGLRDSAPRVRLSVEADLVAALLGVQAVSLDPGRRDLVKVELQLGN